MIMLIVYFCAILLFLIDIIIRRNIYFRRTYSLKEDKFYYESKVDFPLWLLLLYIISLFIPVFNVLYFLFHIIFMIFDHISERRYIYFNDNTILGKFCKFLNKNIF